MDQNRQSLHFNTLKSLKNLLTNTALAEDSLDHTCNDTALNTTSARTPDTLNLLLATRLLARRGSSTNHVHIFGIGDTRLGETGGGIDRADR